ncbi:uncharacterized protein LOC117314617 [Pecten maximus]|uniref:uncharacterized protein LOC117314617 n=1 Tax=Pecten maximus TaxID=6579 RepID=UPI001458ED73|nr:uncharacterized protein LOC117314617 [Pecten maximus]
MDASKHDLPSKEGDLDEEQHSQSPRKKPRQKLTQNDSVFHDFPVTMIKGLADCLNHWILDKSSFSFKTLTALKFLNCNAADTRQGNTFSQVFCSVKPYRQLHPLGDLFTKGLLMLTDFMTSRQVPQNIEEKRVLGKLLNFLIKNTEAKQSSLKNLEKYNESELAIVLANHLFGKLSTSDTFVINQQSKHRSKDGGQATCPCDVTTCELTGTFGDTSVGNCKVWHGNLGIIINNDTMLESVTIGDQVNNPNDKDDTSTDDEDSSDDCSEQDPRVKLKECLSRNNKLLAESIVFSFLQKQKHPKKEHFLCPCIGVKAREMIVFCYDSQHDVLLESSAIPLLSENLTTLGKINTLAIVVAWLVVNYKYLCNGLTDDMKIAKSMFFSQAESKLNIYNDMLKLGEVGNAYFIEDDAMKFLSPNSSLALRQLNERVLKLRYSTKAEY